MMLDFNRFEIYQLYFAIAVCVVFVCVQEVFKKGYLLKYKDGNEDLYNAASILAAIPVFVIVNGGFPVLHLPTVLYALGYACCYAVALIFTMKALNLGSMAMTVMVLSLSFVVSIAAGIFIFGEPVTVFSFISILLLAVIVALLFTKSPREGEGAKRDFSVKWLLCAGLASLGNGMCGVLTKFQSVYYPAYKEDMMIHALSFVLLICTGILLVKACRGVKVMRLAAPTVLFGGLTGLCNGVANWLTINLVANQKIGLTQTTVITRCGTFALTFVISAFLYKEKLSLRQKIAFAMGVAAVLLYNL